MSTTRTILICSGKGGVGKTTTTANLGIALARQGAKTVVLDADFGLRNLDLLLGWSSPLDGVFDLLASSPKAEALTTVSAAWPVMRPS